MSNLSIAFLTACLLMATAAGMLGAAELMAQAVSPLSEALIGSCDPGACP